MKTISIFYRQDENDFNSLIEKARSRSPDPVKIFLIPETLRQQLEFDFKDRSPEQDTQFWYQR